MAAARKVTPQELWESLRLDWWVFDGAQKREGENWRAAVEQRRRQLRVRDEEISTNDGLRGEIGVSERDRLARSLVLIAEPDPVSFLAGFLAALLEGWDIALANPNWGAHEWNAVGKLLSPQLVMGQDVFLNATQKTASNAEIDSLPTILIPTGGSTGQVKFACHSWPSLTASALGFLQYFSPSADPIDTYCVLPLYHVSGLMQVLRTWLSGGQITLTSFQTLKALFPPELSVAEASPPLPLFPFSPHSHPAQNYISLVPTQLQYLIQFNASSWLRQFQAVLLGGAPPWPSLLARAAEVQIPVYLSYGMTETAAMVTLLSLTDFLQGSRSSGKPMPHAAIEVLKDHQPVPPGEVGQVVICTAAAAQSYYNMPSTAFGPNVFRTDDLGYLSADGQLHIVGRASSKIISGGENIFPEEVEAAIHSTQQVKDVCVIGLPDAYWGECVVAAYVPNDPTVSTQSLREALSISDREGSSQPKLSRYKHPKHWVALSSLPRNTQGKLNRSQLLHQVEKSLQIPLSNLPAPSLGFDGGDRAS